MNYLLYITLILGFINCNINSVIAQTDSTKNSIDPQQEYLDRIAKTPYPKLRKELWNNIFISYCKST